jgi:hypothetical protein
VERDMLGLSSSVKGSVVERGKQEERREHRDQIRWFTAVREADV